MNTSKIGCEFLRQFCLILIDDVDLIAVENCLLIFFVCIDTAQKNDNEHCDSEVDEDPQLILFCHFEKRLIKTHTGSSFQGLLR